MMVYLDNSATTKQLREVSDVMRDVVENDFGNPSSLHRMGVIAEKHVKTARKQVSAVINAADDELFFTSGGTESDNTAIFSAVSSLKRQGSHIITSKIEHPAVLEPFRRLEQQGMRVTYIDVDRTGIIDLEMLKDALDSETIFVSIMHVNNETGAIQPIREISSLISQNSPNALFHSDAVQSFGKVAIDVKSMNVDLLSASAHKIHGPKGIGALYVRKGLHLPPFMCGGGQERGFRSGTENVPGIAGFGAASGIAAASGSLDKSLKKTAVLRDLLLQGIETEIGDVLINSPVTLSPEACSPYVLNVSFLGTRGEVILHMLEESDIYVSTGSACSSKKKGGSHVLRAMGLKPDEIEGAVRFSFSPHNTADEIEYTIDKLKKAVASNRRMLSIANKNKHIR